MVFGSIWDISPMGITSDIMNKKNLFSLGLHWIKRPGEPLFSQSLESSRFILGKSSPAAVYSG